MIRTLPPVVKLQAVDEELRAASGGTVTCRLQLERTSNFPGAMRLSLREPSDGPVSCPPVTIPAGATSAEIELSLQSDQAAAVIPLRFRAVGLLTPDTKVVTEAMVNLVVGQ